MNGSEFNYFGVREKVNIYNVKNEEHEGLSGTASGPATSAGDGGAPWQFNPVTTEGRTDSATSNIKDSYVPVVPEHPSQIAFPKIYQRKEIPSDTLGAIYNSNSKIAKPTERLETSVSLNRHQNKTSRK